MNFTRQPRHAECQQEGSGKSFSGTNPSQKEGKLAYIRLNNPTPCPSRSAVPVNAGAWFSGPLSSQHARFAFGQGCDSVPRCRAVGQSHEASSST
jgi:hypothetical protein